MEHFEGKDGEKSEILPPSSEREREKEESKFGGGGGSGDEKKKSNNLEKKWSGWVVCTWPWSFPSLKTSVLWGSSLQMRACHRLGSACRRAWEVSERAANARQLAVRRGKILHSFYTHWPTRPTSASFSNFPRTSTRRGDIQRHWTLQQCYRTELLYPAPPLINKLKP